MSSLLQDLRYGLQMLLTQRAFTAIAVLTIAIGVGANTALFSVVDAVLLKKLPVNNPDQLVLLKAGWNPEKFSPGGFSGSNRFDRETGLNVGTSFPLQTYTRLRQEPGVLSDVFAFARVDMNLNAGGQAEVVNGQAVSGNYYAALGVPAILGRTITDADDNASSAPVAVLSHHFWTKRFNADPSMVGKQININNVPFTIAGVTPPDFNGTMEVGSVQDVTIPIAWESQIAGERSMMRDNLWWLVVMGRLKPGATIEEAQESLAGPFQQSVLEHRSIRASQAKKPLAAVETKDLPRLGVDPGSQGEMNWRRQFSEPLRLLLGVVGLVLLIACANVANLLLVRASSRRKEIAVRLALGASRWRLVRQLMTESVLLAVVGGALGVLFAMWIKDGLLVASEWGGRQMSELTPQLDLRVLGFTFGLSLLTGIIFGLVPAMRATRLDLTPTLKDTGRGSSAVTRSWLSKSLVVVQVSVSVLLLIGAGLLIKSLRNLRNADTGFNANNLLLFRIEPSLIGYRDEKLVGLYEQMFSRLEAVPGVQSVTFSRHPLLAWSSSTSSVFMPDKIGPDGKPLERDAKIHYVRENFLQTLEIPLRTGRYFTAQDDARAPRVAIVNKLFSLVYFGDQNPIGKRFSFDPEKPNEIEIVGMAEDAKYTSQRDDVEPTVYLSWRQSLARVGATTFEIRTAGDPGAVVGGIRQAVREVDSNLPLSNIRTQLDQADETLSMERLFAKLLALFGLIAQLLAAIGLYGVMAYSVSQRTQEIGIRMALGANRGNVMRMVLRQGMILTVVGVVIGIGGAFVLTKYLESLTSMLFGIEARDPLTFVVIPVGLTLVALLACLLPARRATKVDPLVALRYE